MKKIAVLGIGMCMVIAFTSCKSKESFYKKAYENAKKQELTEPQPTVVEEAAPVAEDSTVVATDSTVVAE